MLGGWIVAALVIVVWRMTFASTRVLLVDFSALEILVVRFALAWATLAIVAAHNHPGGTLKASPGNVTLTRELSKAADLLGVRLLDHLIVTKDGFARVENVKECWCT